MKEAVGFYRSAQLRGLAAAQARDGFLDQAQHEYSRSNCIQPSPDGEGRQIINEAFADTWRQSLS
jgi:hypothetical protein